MLVLYKNFEHPHLLYAVSDRLLLLTAAAGQLTGQNLQQVACSKAKHDNLTRVFFCKFDILLEEK